MNPANIQHCSIEFLLALLCIAACLHFLGSLPVCAQQSPMSVPSPPTAYAPSPAAQPMLQFGMDVNEQQGAMNLSIWQAAAAQGAAFVAIKATGGTSFTNPYFATQFSDSRQAGLVRAPYHVGRPDLSDAATQATFFIANGGNVNRSDELNFFGALSLLSNPDCAGTFCGLNKSCYGYDQPSMGVWIRNFMITYNTSQGLWPIIHTTADWYNSCVGMYGDFSHVSPLWISCIECPSITNWPYNWTSYIAWQYAKEGPFPGNQDVHPLNNN